METGTCNASRQPKVLLYFVFSFPVHTKKKSSDIRMDTFKRNTILGRMNGVDEIHIVQSQADLNTEHEWMKVMGIDNTKFKFFVLF